MIRRLSMLILLSLALAAAPAPAGAPIGVTSIRQAGEPLDPSIQNEVVHAVDLAADWLAAHQSADGSWGSETDRVTRTSVALLALTARASRHSDACARAAVWLDGHIPSTNELFAAHAWRIIALLSAAPDTPARTNLTRRLLQEAGLCASATDGWLLGQLLWNDALTLAGQPPLPLPENRAQTLKLEARKWPPAPSLPPGCLWTPVYLISRLSGGTLTRDGEPLDWRRDAAQILINAQRRDPSGGGFWGASERSDRAWQTAFGILTLLEL